MSTCTVILLLPVLRPDLDWLLALTNREVAEQLHRIWLTLTEIFNPLFNSKCVSGNWSKLSLPCIFEQTKATLRKLTRSRERVAGPEHGVIGDLVSDSYSFTVAFVVTLAVGRSSRHPECATHGVIQEFGFDKNKRLPTANRNIVPLPCDVMPNPWTCRQLNSD